MSLRPLSTGMGKVSLMLSSFESEALPMEDASLFQQAYSEFKARHPKADHYPYAFCVGDYSKSSDDGEPGGSGGKPMLTLLQEKGIDCCLLVVARYFGGTKLGVGRLKRCFLSAASEALSSCKMGEEREFLCLELSLSYSRYEEIKRLCRIKGFRLCDEDFGLSVKANLLVDGRIAFSEEDLLLTKQEILSRKNVFSLLEVPNDPC